MCSHKTVNVFLTVFRMFLILLYFYVKFVNRFRLFFYNCKGCCTSGEDTFKFEENFRMYTHKVGKLGDKFGLLNFRHGMLADCNKTKYIHVMAIKIKLC